MNRTLVCILCQTRSWELTWPKFKHNILDALQADLALCISVPDNYNYQNPLWQHAKYKITFPEYDDWGDALDYIQDVETNFNHTNKPNWREALQIGNYWLGGVKNHPKQQPGSGAIIFAARWYLLQFIKNENIFDKYDRIVVTRSDYIHNVPHPSVTILDPTYIWVPDGEGYGGITDRHAVLSKYNYEEYLNLMSNLVTKHSDFLFKMANDSWNPERFLKLNVLEQKRQIKFYPYHMYTVRQSNDHTTWAKGSYSSEHGHYIKYDLEYSSTVSITPHIEKQKDWVNIIVNNSALNCFNAFIQTENDEYLTYDEEKDIYRVVEKNESPSFVLVLDCKNGQGEIFLSSIHIGLFERVSVNKVSIKESQPGWFSMQTLDTNEYVFVHNNILSKSSESVMPNLFKLKNRYHRIMN